jgi:hypothetical protein
MFIIIESSSKTERRRQIDNKIKNMKGMKMGKKKKK